MIAVWQDLRTGRISNGLIVSGLITGLAVRMTTDGPEGISLFLVRVICPMVVLYILFYIKALGAGDVKLFATISPLLTKDQMINMVLVSFFIGAGFSCYKILKSGEMLIRMGNVLDYTLSCIRRKRILQYSTLDNGNSYIKFSGCILAGYISVMIGEYIF